MINYTTIHTNQLQYEKNITTMAKSPPKSLDNQSSRRTSIHCHVKVKCPQKLHQKSPQNTEAKQFNAIMEQLEDLDRNGHGRNNNINHFAPLFE